MDYSKISNIELINFMSFKKAKLSFDETGIINIKGYNDSGKSAILRGIAVCLMDMFKSKQLKFIRHGEEYFRIVITFDDGVSILRDKYINGQSLYEVYKDQELIFTTKQGNRLSKISGVPQQISDYLGLCVTDSVYLNYQSCLDKLPVVDSTGSENYQMFHEILRMEEIYVANNMINIDKNDLALEASTIEYNLNRDKMLLEACGDVSQEFIDVISRLDVESSITNNKKSSISDISSIIQGYDNIKNLPKIEKVSTDRLCKVLNIKNLVSTLDSQVEVPKIEKVSVKRLSALNSIYKNISMLQGYVEIPKVPKVNEDLINKKSHLINIIKVFNTLAKQEEVCSDIDNRISSAKEKLDTLVSSAKEQGIAFVKCENCGCFTVAGGGHVHE